jgi:hypothetical protein
MTGTSLGFEYCRHVTAASRYCDSRFGVDSVRVHLAALWSPADRRRFGFRFFQT